MKRKGWKPVAAAALAVSMWIAGCRKADVQQQPVLEILSEIEKTEYECSFALLPWGTKKAEVMKIQGWTEADLEKLTIPDGESSGWTECLTKQLPVEEADARVRIRCAFFGDEQLGMVRYILYFEKEDAAKEFFEMEKDKLEEINRAAGIETGMGDAECQIHAEPRKKQDGNQANTVIDVRYYGTEELLISNFREDNTDSYKVEIWGICDPGRADPAYEAEKTK